MDLELGVQIALHGGREAIRHIGREIVACNPSEVDQFVCVDDSGRAAHNATGHVGHPPTGLGMDTLTQQSDSLDHETGLLKCFPNGSIL